jgi:hypothetical protein
MHLPALKNMFGRFLLGAVVTALAFALLIFWAITFDSGSILYSSDETQAAVIRRYFHFRIVQPEWLGSAVTLDSWENVERNVRMAIVYVGWAVAMIVIICLKPRKPQNAD